VRVQQLLDVGEPGVERRGQVGVRCGHHVAQPRVPDLGAVHVGLEVPQVRVRPGLLLARHLAARDLVEQALRAVADLVHCQLEPVVVHPRVELGRVGDELVRVLRALSRRQRDVGGATVRVGCGWPEVLLEQVPAGPGGAGLDVGLAQVHPRVEIAERLGDRLDALPVGARGGVGGPRGVVVAREVGRRELLRRGEQLLGLVLDVGDVARGRRSDLIGARARGLDLRTRIRHRERRAQAGADHSGLARGLVAAGLRGEHEGACRARADVLDLGEDP